MIQCGPPKKPICIGEPISIGLLVGSKFGRSYLMTIIWNLEAIWNPPIDIIKQFFEIMHWKSNVVWSSVFYVPNESTLHGYEHCHRFIFLCAISTLLTPNVLW